jgi:hypothetical protein
MGQFSRDELEQTFRTYDADHPKKRTRFDWGNGPDWTKGGRTWFERPPVR